MFPTLPSLARLSDPFRRVQTGFRRAQQGLYHGRIKQYGNNNPFSKKKTRRTWLPNIQPKHLYSVALQKVVSLKVTTRALKTIKKYNGLDSYLLNTPANLLGEHGVQLRGRILEVNKQKDLQKAGFAKLQKLQYAALEERLKQLQDTRIGRRPTRADAHDDRLKAGEALGLDGPASAKLTIRWLQERDQERQRLLRTHPTLSSFYKSRDKTSSTSSSSVQAS